MHQPVIGGGPDLALAMRRFHHAGAARVHLRPGALAGDVAAGMPLPRDVVQAEVRRYLLPAHALVAGAEHVVAAGVEHAAVMRREHDRIGPGEAVFQVLRRHAGGFFRPDIHQLNLVGPPVIALQRARAAGAGAHGAAIDDVGILRMHRDEAALAGARIAAIPQRDRAPHPGAGRADRRVVLLRAIDAVRILVVDVDPVELPGQLVVDRRPGFAAVERHAGAAVIALHHPLRVGGVDPQVVVVAMRRHDLSEAAAAVGGLPHAQVGHVDRVGMAGIGEHMRVVPGPVHQVAVRGHLHPARPVILRAVQPGLLPLGLHQRPHPPGPHRRNGDADLAQHAVRQAGIARDLLPGVAAIGGAEQPAARPAAGDVPEIAPRLPEAGEQDARVGGIHRQFHRPGVGVAVQHLLPVCPAVARAVHAARFVRPEDVAQRRDIDQVGVGRVHQDAPDMPGLAQPHMRPGQPGIGRFVDAVAIRHVQPDRRLAHPGIDDVRVRPRHRDRAHGGGVEEPVAHAAPVHPAIDRLPHPARAGAEIGHHRVVGVARHGYHAAAA